MWTDPSTLLVRGRIVCVVSNLSAPRDGKNWHPSPLREWFQDWNVSLYFKEGLKWRDRDNPNVSLVRLSANALARLVHRYWVGDGTTNNSLNMTSDLCHGRSGSSAEKPRKSRVRISFCATEGS